MIEGRNRLRYVICFSKALDKREMFGDQTPSNIVWWPNILMMNWVAKRLKHVWSNTDQTQIKQLIQAAEQAWYAFLHQTSPPHPRLSKRKKKCPIKHENKRNVLSFWSNVWRPSNFINHDQTRSNTVKQHQTKCPNGKMFGRQNIPRLSRP